MKGPSDESQDPSSFVDEESLQTVSINVDLIRQRTDPGPSPTKANVEVRREHSDPVTVEEKDKVKGYRSNTNLGTILRLVKRRTLSISNVFRASHREPTVPVFHCNICLENHAEGDGYPISNCSDHLFCRECLEGYITSQINDGVIKHVCPGDSCSQPFTDAELETLVEADTYEKYTRFKAVKENPDYRECPSCNRELQFNLHSQTGNQQGSMATCECGAVSCFYHGNAHPNETCARYASRIRRDDLASRRAVGRIARKCPRCHVDTEKNGGCNHMTCRNCATNWCWLCGRVMESNHFEPDNLFGCPNMQFAPAPAFAWWAFLGSMNCGVEQAWCRVFLNFPVMAGSFLIQGIALLALVVALFASLPFLLLFGPLILLLIALMELCCNHRTEAIFTLLLPAAVVGGIVLAVFMLLVTVVQAVFVLLLVLLPFSPVSLWSAVFCCSCNEDYIKTILLLIASPGVMMIAFWQGLVRCGDDDD